MSRNSKPVESVLIEVPEASALGVTLHSSSAGVIITTCTDDSPLRAGGLDSGDEIVSMNGVLTTGLTVEQIGNVWQSTPIQYGARKLHLEVIKSRNATGAAATSNQI